MKPNFLIIGAAKSATTMLVSLLSRHPEIFISNPKEPNFFSFDKEYKKGMRFYESLFANASGKKAIGEASTTYSIKDVYPLAHERIKFHLPNVKIIYLTRDPLSRLESLWIQYRHSGQRINNTFASRSFNKDLLGCSLFIESSLYHKQINVYRQFIPDGRILVLFFEDFISNPNKVLKTCFKFLDVDPNCNIALDKVRADDINSWRDKMYDGFILSSFRWFPFFDSIKNMVPSKLRNFLRLRFKYKFNERPKWDSNVRARVIEILKRDNHAFLKRYGKPAEFWNNFL